MLFPENLHNSMKTTEEKAREIAKNMIDMGMTNDIIRKATGLNEEEIEMLRVK